MEKIMALITSPMYVGILTLLFTCMSIISFAHAENGISLLEVSELQRDAAKYNTILDARPKSEYEKGHIPGAIPFSWEDYTETDGNCIKYRIWPPERLAVALKTLGIDENTPIVVYGDADKSWGGEAWICWMFAWLGHQAEIRLLNGGIQAWKMVNGAVEQGEFKKIRNPKPEYKINQNKKINITAHELMAARNINIIDVRSNMEWVMGHIPNTIHIPWEHFYTGQEHRMITPAEFRKLMNKHNVKIDKPTVYYCTGGIRSAWTWLAHTLSIGPTAINFEGGIEEWNKLK